MVERLRGLPQGAERKLHARAVVREEALIAKGERIDSELDELVHRDRVARGLRHLHPVGEQVLAVDPVAHGRCAERAFGLGDLVLVVREDVVNAASV